MGASSSWGINFSPDCCSQLDSPIRVNAAQFLGLGCCFIIVSIAQQRQECRFGQTKLSTYSALSQLVATYRKFSPQRIEAVV